jgi:hypothetical protein
MVNLSEAQKAAFTNRWVESTVTLDEKPIISQVEQQAVAKTNAETQALMQMKAALIETTASRGWFYIDKFAETIVRELETKALAEDDDQKANGLRRDARGARKFKDELLKRIALAKKQEPENFLEVVTD